MLFAPAVALADHERIIEIKDALPPEPNSNLVERVVVPMARIAVVSEVANVLVVGRHPGTNDHLLIFPLDEAGRAITNAPVTVTLPRPDAISKFQNFALSMAAHPTLPLLYVWQDVQGHHCEPPTDPAALPVYRHYEHLQIYNLGGGNAELVMSTARGEEFCYAMFHHGYGGAIGLDLENKRLYLPSMREVAMSNTVWGVLGFAHLNGDGLPVLQDNKLALTMQNPLGGTVPPVGLGWIADGTNRVVFVGPGVGTWDLNNRRARVGFMYLGRSSYRGQMVTHPTLPMMYVAWGDWAVDAIELANGFPTLVPQELTTPHQSGPVFLPKLNRLAVGWSGRVMLLRLTEDGWFTKEATAIPVPHYRGEALCYSPKFDRLYVPVEKLE